MREGYPVRFGIETWVVLGLALNSVFSIEKLDVGGGAPGDSTLVGINSEDVRSWV